MNHPSEAQLLLDVLFLEECMDNGTIPENIISFTTSESAKVRKLALLLCKLGGFCLDSKFSTDPTASIRSFYLSNLVIGSSSVKDIHLDAIIPHISDRNPSVRIAVLKSIRSLSLSPQTQNRLLPSLLHLINDTSSEVRLLFCKLLKKFKDLKTSLILGMLDKEKDGTLIYGAEDELVRIRLATVGAIRWFVREDTAAVLFDFLLDLLNDSQDVRLRCMRLLRKIIRKFPIKKKSHEVHWLVLSSGNQSLAFTSTLIGVLTHLEYANLEELKITFTQSLFHRFDTRTVLGILDGVVKRNVGLFSHGPVFSTDVQRQSYSIEYLCDLLLMSKGIEMVEEKVGDINALNSIIGGGECSELRELYDILYDCNTKNTINSEVKQVKVDESKGNSNGDCGYYDDITILERINNRMKAVRTITRIGKFIKEYFEKLGDVGIERGILGILIIPYKFRFSKRRLNSLCNKRNLNSSSSLTTAVKIMRLIIKMLIKCPEWMEMRDCGITVKRVLSGGDFPTEIWLKVRGDRKMKVVIEDIGMTGQLVFKLEDELKITVEENCKLIGYVAIEICAALVRVSAITEIL